MATKKDLVEAQGFARRRLTTAFVSGAPGGREVEPTNPLRALIGGVVVAALLAVGGLVGGFLKPSLPSGWDDNKLVIAKQSGARYFSSKKTLYPVINTTSARLLITGQFEVVTIDDGKIAQTKIGPTLGIIGAPDSLPVSDSLISSGWVSCVRADGGVRTVLATGNPSEASPDKAAVVTSGKQTFVISGGRRFPVKVPADQRDGFLRAIGLDSAQVLQVPASWVNLWPLGSVVAPISISGVGKPIPGAAGPEGTAVGAVFAIGGDSARRYLVTEDGRLAPLSPFAYELYRLGSGSGQETISVTPAQTADMRNTTSAAIARDWPTALPAPIGDQACAALSSGPGKTPSVTLSTSTAATVNETGVETNVATGHGALVRAVGGSDITRGPILAIDGSATAYSIANTSADGLAQLGYTDKNVTPIPAAWAELFRSGPTLSTEAAQTTVAAAK